MSGQRRVETGRAESAWQTAGFRANMRQLTAAWGVALVAEAAVRVGLSFVVAPATLMAILPVLMIATVGPLVALTMRSRAQAQHLSASHQV